MNVRPIACLCLCAAALAGQTGPERFAVGGVALDSVSLKPVARLRVVLSQAGDTTGPGLPCTTGEDGRFRFDVPAGKYRLAAERSGLSRQRYGASRLGEGFGISIVAGPGQMTGDLVFAIHPPAAIAGKIVDEEGEPVEGAFVQLVRSGISAGRKISAEFRWARSNDLGEYRFGGLPAGIYYVAVTGKPWYAKTLSQVNQFATVPDSAAYAPSFYPDAADPRAAAPLVLSPGQEASAGFRLRTVTGHELLVTAPDSAKWRNATVKLIAEGMQGVKLYSEGGRFLSGTWRTPALTPGRYLIQLTEDPDRLLASANVEMGAANQQVQLKFDVPSVTGTVELVGAGNQINRRLLIALEDEENLEVYPGHVDASGSFTFPGVAPGRYRVRLYAGKRIYVRSVTTPAGAVKDRLLEVGASGHQDVKVVADFRTGRVKGFVFDAGRPAPGVLVLLAPAGGSTDPSDYQGFQTDSDGSFDYLNVPAGEYRIAALREMDFEYANPALAEPVLRNAKLLRVDSGSVVEQRLELSPLDADSQARSGR